MKPVKFKGANVTFAEDQPQYQPLHALRLKDEKGTVVSCWTFGFWERIQVLFFGRVWLRLCTFGRPLQPQMLSVECPFVRYDDFDVRNRDDQVI